MLRCYENSLLMVLREPGGMLGTEPRPAKWPGNKQAPYSLSSLSMHLNPTAI